MADFRRLTWQSNPAAGSSRQDRSGCLYNAYIPDPLLGRELALDSDAVSDIAEAEAAIARLNVEATALTNTEVLARLLLRAESVASSKIEGLVIGGRRLLHAELSRQIKAQIDDVTASDVLRNIDAMLWAVEASAPTSDITLEIILETHRRLLSGTPLEEHAGVIRDQQNWIGGSDYNPCSAAYVPPPPDRLPDLLTDLVSFCNQESLSPVVQAALAHAQFETIHPFVDGNGRTGRALVHMIFRRRGLAPRVLPPVSLILATWVQDYIEGLSAFRYTGPADSKDAYAGVNKWLSTFAAACSRSVDDASRFEARVSQLQSEWRTQLGTVRKNSALDRLLRILPGAPIITPTTGAKLIGRTFQAANEAIERLVEAQILKQINIGRRNRAFEAREIVDAFNQLER